MTVVSITEEKILLAAEEIFVLNGYDGSRMQAIADKANINKAMLHYYFRSKEKLFERIFEEKVLHFFPKIEEDMVHLNTFLEKADLFIERYIHLINQYPYIPFFVVNTINKPNNQVFIEKLPLSLKRSLLAALYADIEKGLIKDIQPFQFIMSLLGMCAFPYLMAPIFKHSFRFNDAEFSDLMILRIAELKRYIRFILLP